MTYNNNNLLYVALLVIVVIIVIFLYFLYRNRNATQPAVYGFLGKRLSAVAVFVFAILAISTTTYFIQTNNIDDRSLANVNDTVRIDYVKNDATIELTGKYLNQTTNEYIFEWTIKASNIGISTQKETKLSVSKISIANANIPIQITLQIRDVNTGSIVGTKSLEIK